MEIRLLMIGEGGRGEYGFSSVYVCMYVWIASFSVGYS